MSTEVTNQCAAGDVLQLSSSKTAADGWTFPSRAYLTDRSRRRRRMMGDDWEELAEVNLLKLQQRNTVEMVT